MSALASILDCATVSINVSVDTEPPSHRCPHQCSKNDHIHLAALIPTGDDASITNDYGNDDMGEHRGKRAVQRKQSRLEEMLEPFHMNNASEDVTW